MFRSVFCMTSVLEKCLQQVGFVNLRHFFQHRSHAKHWFKNLKILPVKILMRWILLTSGPQSTLVKKSYDSSWVGCKFGLGFICLALAWESFLLSFRFSNAACTAKSSFLNRSSYLKRIYRTQYFLTVPVNVLPLQHIKQK